MDLVVSQQTIYHGPIPHQSMDSLAYVHLFKAMLRLTSNFCQGNTHTRIYEDVRVFQKYITESCNNMEAIRIFIVVLLLEFVARAYLKRNKIRFSI